jgi:outer membrane lipoprotein LolB
MLLPFVRCAICVLFIGLSACTTMAPPLRVVTRVVTPVTYHQHLVRNAAIDTFVMDGRVAMKTAKDGFTAGLHFQKQPAALQMELLGPLGGSQAKLTETVDSAELLLPDQAPYQDRDAERLLREQFGWAVPVKRLPYWLLGLATPGQTPHAIDNQGLPSVLREDDWSVRYLAWQQINGAWLPEKLEITNSQLTIKLSIHDWQF